MTSKALPSTSRIISWNVNGIRAASRKGFVSVLENSCADIFAVQEARCQEEQLPPDITELTNWRTHWVSAERKGYSGVGIFARRPWIDVQTTMGSEAFDCEGRLQLLRFGALLVANVYFPNGSGKNRDNSRIPFKLDFYRRLFEILDAAKEAGDPILVLGDFNTAHQENDLARPKQNEKTSGFCPEERQELDRWLSAGWVDTFRLFHSGNGHYSWWSQRFGVREKNIGWRIDYVFASPGAQPFIKDAFILPHVMGSDHCPVGVDVDSAIYGDEEA